MDMSPGLFPALERTDGWETDGGRERERETF